jgi:hypothetical protein
MTYPSGAYRRSIMVVASQGAVTSELEDDFHHFRVTITHDGERVTGVEAEGVRFPWATCPIAAQELQPLVGMALSTRSTAVGDVVSARDNCTHQFDLAGLAVAHAARGAPGARRYDITVHDPVDRRRQAGLVRSGREGGLTLDWIVDDNTILAPSELAGRPLRGGFLEWAEQTLGADEAEAAIALRRACYIAFGRRQDLDVFDDAVPLLGIMSGSCFTFRPERARSARRIKGSVRDFTAEPPLARRTPPDG